jgi:hypothetical protein
VAPDLQHGSINGGKNLKKIFFKTKFSFWSDNNKAKITLGKRNEAKKMKRNKAK